MTYDRGLVARVADVVEQIGIRGVRQKGVFGGFGFLVGKRAFAIVWGDDLIVKTTAADYETLLAEPGVSPFQIGEQPSRNWVVVSAESIADDPELIEWIRRALALVYR